MIQNIPEFPLKLKIASFETSFFTIQKLTQIFAFHFIHNLLSNIPNMQRSQKPWHFKVPFYL